MNNVRSRVLLAGTLALIAGMAVGAGAYETEPTEDRFAHLPSSVQLTGVVRDFKEKSVAGGHPDFERQPTSGFAMYSNTVQNTMDVDNKPVFRSTGNKVTTDFKDSSGRAMISPREYIQVRPGDVAGVVATTAGGALTNAANHAQWFRDVPAMNISKQLSLNLVRQPNTNIYTFNDRTDPLYSSKGGFFPIDGELFGNSAGGTKNFHFTIELQTMFTFKRGTGQVFTFTGDDDVYVFIDGKLVIDIGGVHSAKSQTIDVDRLGWLVDGTNYPLSFFFVERHRTQSNFRIDTNMMLRNLEMPSTTALYD